MTIIFYDIPCVVPGHAWSPNTWKARFCLNYKGLPYRTEWVEYPDIADTCKKLGIAPTSQKKVDGSPHYTLPAIHDPATGVSLSDSFAIAEYLDKTYPDTPSIFPHSTTALQATFEGSLATALIEHAIGTVSGSSDKLNPPSKAYHARPRTKSPFDGSDEAQAKWAKIQEGLGKVDAWYVKSGGPFLVGSTPSWADFVVGAWLIFIRFAWGEDSKEWRELLSWQDGRWAKLVDTDLKQYQTVV